MSDFCFLQNGLVIPKVAVDALLAIENAGHSVTTDGTDLLIQRRGTLDDHDMAQIKRWKPHVILLLRYTANDQHIRDYQHPAPDCGPIVVGRKHA